MNHTSDQDLLLMAHNSLGFVKEIGVRMHVRSCPRCQARLTEMSRVSGTVASAIRVGMPSWNPLGISFRLKLLFAAMVVTATLFGGQMITRQIQERRALEKMVGPDGLHLNSSGQAPTKARPKHFPGISEKTRQERMKRLNP